LTQWTYLGINRACLKLLIKRGYRIGLGYNQQNMHNFNALFFYLQNRYKLVTKFIVKLLYIEIFYMNDQRINNFKNIMHYKNKLKVGFQNTDNFCRLLLGAMKTKESLFS
jgi:hypothetical protein